MSLGKMTPHELLINIVGAMVLNIIPYPMAPIAPSGILGAEFGYTIQLPQFGEAIKELMKTKGAKVPDLLLVNKEKRLLVIVECKSGFTFQVEEKLSKQIEFYSSQDFKKIAKEMFPDLDNHEIWVFCTKKLCNQIVKSTSSLINTKNLANILVWGVELKKAQEEAQIQKDFGTSLDHKLEEKIKSEAFFCSLPRIELLVDPTLEYGERVFRIGRRFFAFVATSYLHEKDRIVTLEDFRRRNLDAIMTDKELKKCLRYLTKLIPELGVFNSATGEVVLAKRPPLDKIKTKLVNLQDMTKQEIIVELEKISKNRRSNRLGRPKAQQKTKLSKWFPTTGGSKTSGLFFPFDGIEPQFTKKEICFIIHSTPMISKQGGKKIESSSFVTLPIWNPVSFN